MYRVDTRTGKVYDEEEWKEAFEGKVDWIEGPSPFLPLPPFSPEDLPSIRERMLYIYKRDPPPWVGELITSPSPAYGETFVVTQVDKESGLFMVASSTTTHIRKLWEGPYIIIGPASRDYYSTPFIKDPTKLLKLSPLSPH